MSWRSEYRILYDKMLFSGIVIKVRTFNVVFPFDQNHIRFYTPFLPRIETTLDTHTKSIVSIQKKVITESYM